MPPEPRRSSRKTNPNHEGDLEARRSRGEISCAECRRLKLKCDKKIPCCSCVRRGCQSICPTGSLSTGQGTRFVLADTSQLHTKIAEMGQRIRQLEDALAIFQSGVSDECHPLLSSELLAIKFGPEKTEAEAQVETLSATLDALGTLTIGEGGEAKYFGRSAGAETLILAGAENVRLDGSDAPYSISDDLAKLSNSFPFGEILSARNDFFQMIAPYFPERLRAWSLCELYTEQFAWSFSPIPRDEIVDDYLTLIYKALNDLASGNTQQALNVTPHRCAVLFSVFAIGSWVDLTVENYSLDADRFYHLSRACLSMRSIFDSPEVATVQAISLLSVYHGLEGRKYTMDSSWALVSLANKLAQSLGLHRDSARWNMHPKTVNRRRHLFWEIYSNEIFYCMGLGRPPSIRLSYIDTELPEDTGILDSNGQPSMGFYRWKHEFVRSLYSDMVETMLSAVPPTYETVLELDRRAREKYLPSHLNVAEGLKDDVSPRTFIHATLLGTYRAVLLLYIHRSFFAQALLDHPINPLRSPYAPSFTASYRCAFTIMRHTTDAFRRFPELFYRLWHPWTHLFSAAMIFASIVSHAPTSSLAQNCLVELEVACSLFEKVTTRNDSLRIKSAARVLQRMRVKAYKAYNQDKNDNSSPKELSLQDTRYGESELAIFGGQTRLLVTKHISSHQDGRSSSHSPPSIACSPCESVELQDVHPPMAEASALLQGIQPPPPFNSIPMLPANTPDWSTDPNVPFDVPDPGFQWPGFAGSSSEQQTPPTHSSDPFFFLSAPSQSQPSTTVNDQWQAFMTSLFSE